MESMEINDTFFPRSDFIMKLFTSVGISGLAYGYSYVEIAVSGGLIGYIPWKNKLVESVMVISFMEGLSTTFIFFLTGVSDRYLGPFKAIALATFLYLTGLLMLEFSKPVGAALFLVGAVLLSIGKAVKKPVVRHFLVDQYSHDEDNQEQKTTDIWWRCSCSFGVLSAIIYNAICSSKLNMQVLVSLIILGIAYCIFWFGFPLYLRRKPTSISGSQIFHQTNTDFHGQEEEKTQLFKMLPMWAVFGVFSLVKVSGVTFFVLQVQNFHRDEIENQRQFHVCILLMIFEVSNSGSACVCKSVIEKMKLNVKHAKDVALAKIVAGLACCLLCCITAYFIEVLRLQHIQRPTEGKEISANWMVPQFICLGLMTGLAEGGLSDLQLCYIPQMWNAYDESNLNELVLGFLKFLNIPFILSCRCWIKDTVNTSRLDHFYLVLVILSSANYFLCLYVCTLYHDAQVPAESGSCPIGERSLNILRVWRKQHNVVVFLNSFQCRRSEVPKSKTGSGSCPNDEQRSNLNVLRRWRKQHNMFSIVNLFKKYSNVGDSDEENRLVFKVESS